MNRALFIGRSVLDVTSLVEDFPGPDGKTKALANAVMPGGSALNAAVVYAHLGGDVTLATSLGKAGLMHDVLCDDLATHKVTLYDICADPVYSIPLSTVISTRSLGTRLIVNGAGGECEQFKDCRDLFNDSYALIQLDQWEQPFVMQYQDAIRAFNGPVVLDCGSWKDWSPDFLRLADIPIVSEVFCPDGSEAFTQMCNELGLSRWAITRGAKGVIWRDGDHQGVIPAHPIEVVDTLGAGDIFHGAFCHAYVQSGDFTAALEVANQISATACTSVGTRSWMHD